jgi:hypothetical protein
MIKKNNLICKTNFAENKWGSSMQCPEISLIFMRLEYKFTLHFIGIHGKNGLEVCLSLHFHRYLIRQYLFYANFYEKTTETPGFTTRRPPFHLVEKGSQCGGKGVTRRWKRGPSVVENGSLGGGKGGPRWWKRGRRAKIWHLGMILGEIFVSSLA